MVGVHLCGGQIQDVALFTKADVCEMEKKMPPCHKHLAKPCCEDETIVHTGENFKVSSTDVVISPIPATDMELPAVLISEIIPSTPLSHTPLYNYDPPLRPADLTVSFRVFLI